MALDGNAVPLVPAPAVPGTGAIDLDATVREYVGRAVLKYRLGETYWYSVAATVINGPTGPSPAFVTTMYTRSPVLGSVLVEGAVQTGFPTADEFDAIVSNLIDGLRRQVREALR